MPVPSCHNQGYAQQQKGFTLLELMVVTVLIGLIAPLINQIITTSQAARDRAYVAEESQNNRKISEAIIEWAATDAMNNSFPGLDPGRLPDSPGDWTLVDSTPEFEGLRARISQVVAENAINTDGSIVGYQRAYQIYRVEDDQAYRQRLWGSYGPELTVNYDVGTLWLSRCEDFLSVSPTVEPSCGDGRPGYSPELSASENDAGYYRSYEFETGDIGPVFFSTLRNQQRTVNILSNQIETLRNRLLEAFRNRAARVSGGQVSDNHFLPFDKSSLAERDPTLPDQQGCTYEWIDLGHGLGTEILGLLGFSADQGETPWGGQIEYCPDYNPSSSFDSDQRNQAPHAAAIRFHESVTEGLPIGDSGNNVLVVF